jgi:hypothetical protein
MVPEVLVLPITLLQKSRTSVSILQAGLASTWFGVNENTLISVTSFVLPRQINAERSEDTYSDTE